VARRGEAGLGKVIILTFIVILSMIRGGARHGKAGRGKARQGWARHGEAGQGKARHGGARQGKEYYIKWKRSD